MTTATSELVETSIVGMDVWNAVLKDPNFAEEVELGGPMLDAVKPFMENSVDALQDLLDEPASTESIMKSKMTFLKYCSENGFIEKASEASGHGLEMLAGMFEMLIAAMEPIVENIVEFLREQGVTEEQLMTSSEMGLNPENIAKWQSGDLTIADILVSQPSIILKSS